MNLTVDILKKHFGLNDPNFIQYILNNPEQRERYWKEYLASVRPGIAEFMDDINGKKLDTDGYPKDQPFQCVDVIRAAIAGGIRTPTALAKKYPKGVWGLPLVGGNAIDYWNNYPKNPILQKYFERVVNHWWVIPQEGWFAIFEATKGNPAGHIGLVKWGSLLKMTVMQQNDPLRSECHYKDYNYRNPKCIGFLKPKV